MFKMETQRKSCEMSCLMFSVFMQLTCILLKCGSKDSSPVTLHL